VEKPFPAYTGDESYVFVCYAHDDAAVVYPELQRLSQEGVNVWYDEGISAGSNWRATIGESLLGAVKFLFYISPKSLASDHCNREINLALDEGIEVVPVYLQDAELTPDLRVGLSRVQALHRSDRPEYRSRLLNALHPDRSLSVTGSGDRRVDRPRALSQSLLFSGLGVFVLVLVGLGFWYVNEAADDDSRGGGMAADRGIVVLPFANLSPDPEDEYLADGLSYELMLVLDRIPGLRVPSRTASFYFKRNPAELAVIGERLNVSYALEGSVQRNGDAVRVTAQLVDIRKETALFSESFERADGNLLDLQADLALEITNALASELDESASIAEAAAGTDDERAFELFLLAQELRRKDNAVDLRKAEELVQAAIEQDPGYERAYGLLGSILLNAASRTGEFEVYHQKVVDLQSKIDALFPGNSRPRTHRSLIGKHYSDRNWPELEFVIRSRLHEDPTSAQDLHLYANLLADSGLFEAALAYHLAAVAIDPLNPDFIEGAGDMHRELGQLLEAQELFRQCLILAPEREGCINESAIILFQLGREQEAKALLPEENLFLRCALGFEQECAEVHRSRLSTFAGYVAVVQGDLDLAFDHFDRAIERHDLFINQIRWQKPDSEALVDDPRYEDILGRLKLDDAWYSEFCRRAGELTGVTGISTASSCPT